MTNLSIFCHIHEEERTLVLGYIGFVRRETTIVKPIGYILVFGVRCVIFLGFLIFVLKVLQPLFVQRNINFLWGFWWRRWFWTISKVETTRGIRETRVSKGHTRSSHTPEIVGVYDSRSDLTNVIFVCVRIVSSSDTPRRRRWRASTNRASSLFES